MKTQSKRSVVVLFAALVIGAALSAALAGPSRPAGAQSSPAVASDLPRTITVVGEGTVALQPDVAQAQVGVDVVGDNAKDASAEAAKIMDAVLAALEAQGIAKKDIQTSNYSIFAERPADALSGKPGDRVIYRVSNGVSVTIRDLAKIGAVLDAVIDAGANNIYGVTFSVSDPDKVMAEARRKAAEDARARAEELAALHGVALGEVVSVSEVIGGSMPVPMRESVNAVMGFGGGGGNAIQPGEMKMTTQLQAVYAIAGPAGTTMTTTGQAPVAPTTAPLAEGGLGPTVAAAEASPTVASPQPAESSQAQPVATATPIPQVTTVLVERFLASPPGPAANPGKVTITEDDTLLRPFVERWLLPPSSDFPQAEAALRLGQLPEDIPFELPVPTDTTLISSLTQGDPPYSEILLTTRQSAAEVLDFYREKLIALGMVTPPADPGMVDVFSLGSTGLTLCDELSQSFISVSAIDDEAGLTEVRISLQANAGYNPCSPPQSAIMEGAMALLPRLDPPQDAERGRSSSFGGGGGPDSASASADMQTSLSVAELFQHYSDQLEAAGWKLVDESQADAAAWSTWTVRDAKGRDWQSMLLITETPEKPNGRFALLRVERIW